MSESKLRRVIFTCGGTAGHVNPAIAPAQLMQRENPKTEVLFVGAERGLEKDPVPKAGYPFRTVHISSFHRSFRPSEIRHNLVSVENLMRAPHEARAILRDFLPRCSGGNRRLCQLPHGQSGSQGGHPHGGPRVQHGPRPHHGDAGALCRAGHGGL